MVKNIKISAVKYLNTLPFRHGIYNSQYLKKIIAEVSEDTPVDCMIKILNGDAEIGLVPVASLPKINNYEIISDYCIGASQNVRSVFLASQKPLKDIKNIFEDYQSFTSNNLCKILSKYYWQKEFNWLKSEKGYEDKIKNDYAGIIIGDRALNKENEFKYTTDLAYEWQKFKSEEFAFAVWISVKKLPADIISNINKAFEWGIKQIPVLTKGNKQEFEYLTHNIDFALNDSKMKSIELFLNYLKNEK